LSLADGIEVFVLAAPGRDVAHRALRASLHASDVGEDYHWCEHPTGMKALEHWARTFERMAESPAPQVILLEDDCLVNRHLLQNVRMWSWPDHVEFGAGWLYNPGGYCAGNDVWYSEAVPWYGTVGVLYWTADVLTVLRGALRWMRDQGNLHSWDCAVAWAIDRMRLKIRAHGPPIVEHQHQVASALGHRQTWEFGSTRGTFQPDWRPVGCVREVHTREKIRPPDAKPPVRVRVPDAPWLYETQDPPLWLPAP
jgi:hypothetical protein